MKKLTKAQSVINRERSRILNEMNIEDFDFILKHQIRRVKWLYANSNRNTFVYSERLVRCTIQKLQNRIKELENK